MTELRFLGEFIFKRSVKPPLKMYKSLIEISGGHVGVPGVFYKKDLWRDTWVSKATLSFGGDASCLEDSAPELLTVTMSPSCSEAEFDLKLRNRQFFGSICCS